MASKGDKRERKLAEDFLVRNQLLSTRDMVEGFVENYNHARDFSQLAVRLQTLDQTYKDFQKVQSEIDSLDNVDNFDEHLRFRVDFEDSFCRIKGFLLSKLNQPSPPVPTIIEFTHHDHVASSVHHQASKVQPSKADQQHQAEGASAKVAGPTPKKSKSNTVANRATTNPQSSTPKCIACPEKHVLFQCSAFSTMPVRQRREVVSKNRLCWNCFRSGHVVRDCTARYGCRTCHEKHHTLLHEATPPVQISATPVVIPSQPAPVPIPSTSSVVSPGSAHPKSQVSLSVQSSHSAVLQTVSLLDVDQNGRTHPARAPLDTAPMCNRRTKVDTAVASTGESTKQIKRQLTATIHSNAQPCSPTHEFLVLKRSPVNLLTTPNDLSSWKIPKLTVAYPSIHVPPDIDMVVGGEANPQLHTGSKCSQGEGPPLIVETVCGWIVSGKLSIVSPSVPRIRHLTTVDRNLELTLQKFRELEAVEPSSNHSSEETHCEEVYAATTTRDSSVRYIVRLPLTRDPLVTLGEPHSIAERRFRYIERRLERDPPTREAYRRFKEDYETPHTMRRIDGPEENSVPHTHLLHHPVLKESSTTTKTRVVFDASAKTSSALSVNDEQPVGPVVQEELPPIVMRFRIRPIAVVADITKMYRQILLHTEDRPYHCILWRYNQEEPIATYGLQTVTYGFAPLPFPATRTLLQVAQDEAEQHPAAATVAQKDFYMGDFLSGAVSVESATQLRREMSSILSAAELPLKKWASNMPKVLANVPPEDLALTPLHNHQDEQSVSTLGLTWKPRSDTIHFKAQMPLPTPIRTVAKLFMRRLWSLKTDAAVPYDRDRPLPSHLQAEWKQFRGLLGVIANILVPRFVSPANASTSLLHFCCDAPAKAYDACCYVRSESAEVVRVHQLTSNSKVALLIKLQTISRLELSDAVLSSGLCVANRVSLIQAAIEPHTWNHVSEMSKSADVISRGINPTEVLDHPRRCNGPPWLTQSAHWPATYLPALNLPVMTEGRTTVVMLSAATIKDKPFSEHQFRRFSSFTKLRRTIACCKRYCYMSKAAAKSTKPHLLREIGSTNVLAEDLQTLLAQAEMCLNSRPLVPFPSDPSGLEVLTLGHFLIGTNPQAVPERDLQTVSNNLLTHWEPTQKRFQQSWSRWYSEYLQQLQSRASKCSEPPIDNLPPGQWPFGTITSVHHGKDEAVRVVTPETASSETVIRPRAKVALLPIPDLPEIQNVPDAEKRPGRARRNLLDALVGISQVIAVPIPLALPVRSTWSLSFPADDDFQCSLSASPCDESSVTYHKPNHAEELSRPISVRRTPKPIIESEEQRVQETVKNCK